MSEIKTINPTMLKDAMDNGNAEIVDVRTPLEFREVHVKGARNVPLDRLDPNELMQNRNGSADKPLYVICKSGSRGQKACGKIADCGFENVINIEGGTDACLAAGLPVVRGKKAMSLERQVRITAGTIILGGSIAALATGIIWLAAIPAFVGAGLAFAGITDTCAMGMLIAKMPWNQVKTEEPTCEAG